jgi:hypothetical protein
MENGVEVELEDFDFLAVRGILEYSDSEHIWVAGFNPDDLHDKGTDRLSAL